MATGAGAGRQRLACLEGLLRATRDQCEDLGGTYDADAVVGLEVAQSLVAGDDGIGVRGECAVGRSREVLRRRCWYQR